ncbi:MAG: neuromedin U [Geminicoccaceae bacterium]
MRYLVCLCLLMPGAALAQDSDALAKAAQNPVAAMISLPFQNNTFFGVGPHGDVANVLNIQPVVPIGAGDWNIISRTIVPVIYVQDLAPGLSDIANDPQGSDGSFGLGDVNQTFYFSPADAGPVIWGIGPSLSVPTATDDSLGSEKWSAGPAAVVLTMPGPWVIGSLVRQLWSFAGEGDRQDVNQTLIQPFVNYNFPGGWYAVSSPIVTANWEADSDDTWTVPVGGGMGRIFHIGGQAMNASAQAFYNVESPRYGPDWSIRLQLQLLFPK